MNEARALFTFLRTNLGLTYEPVIAGGYARDQILGRPPRDIDVFLLNAADGHSVVIQQLTDHHVVHTVVPKTYATSELAPQFDSPIDFQFLQWPVQLICTPCNSIYEIIESFDYNICQFWLDGNFYPHGYADALDRLVNKDMRLRHVRTPWSSLKRGILLADRFGFDFNELDRKRLVEALYAELHA